jgi:hypothetical protein
MTNRKLAFVSVLFALALTAIPTRSAEAHADVSSFRLKNKSLEASFFTVADCYGVSTLVRYIEAVERVDGQPFITPPSASVELTYSNNCTGETFTLLGGVDPQKLTFSSDLGRASMKATVPVTDGVVSATVTIDLTWTANAPLQQVKENHLTWDPVARTITWDRQDLRARTADVAGVASTVLPDQVGPDAIDLTQVSFGGFLGRNVTSLRTVTFLRP